MGIGCFNTGLTFDLFRVSGGVLFNLNKLSSFAEN